MIKEKCDNRIIEIAQTYGYEPPKTMHRRDGRVDISNKQTLENIY